ncbi:MAG TPA: YkgJ family cysteine cluster protein [Rhodanobacteraceae bacterium]|nr:YkgJ family cysteine cluster protein [Rhodanobacteraceae bacterium]
MDTDAGHDPGPDCSDLDSAIRCSDCEAVCCRLTVLLMPDDNVPPWFTDHEAHGLECMAKGDDGWCVALDRRSMRCSIYSRRPAICRSFAMGGAHCRDERERWFGEPSSAIPVRVLPDDHQGEPVLPAPSRSSENLDDDQAFAGGMRRHPGNRARRTAR